MKSSTTTAPQKLPTTRTADVLVVGAGILGLWAARHALRAGRSVAVVDEGQAGAGASGGFLGALMPHMPDRWNVKKQFQFNCLASIEESIRELEADTGVDCGFRRCGRLVPFAHEAMRSHARARVAGARENWRGRYSMELVEPPVADTGWLDPQAAPFGATFDTLSARVNPRAYISALREFVAGRSRLVENVKVAELQPGEGRARLADGSHIAAGTIVIAAGWRAYDLLQPFLGPLNDGRSLGRGVRGQAVLVEFTHEDELPIVYHDGAYVVPQADNRVAIGSSSHDEWSGPPDAFDPTDMDFYNRALQLVPALRDAPVIGRWAGVRPRNTFEPGLRAAFGDELERLSATPEQGSSLAPPPASPADPYFGPVPGHENLFALIGGFKITFGVAHSASDALRCIHT